jgi:hypothetical protein
MQTEIVSQEARLASSLKHIADHGVIVKKHLGKLIVTICAVVILAGVLLYRHIDSVIRNSYAQWWVADMVIEHLESNDQRWPQSWDELRDDYQTCVKRSGQPWTFEELSHRVEIDWNADPKVLKAAAAKSGQPPFRVIWLSDESTAHWTRHEPNQMVWDYLHEPLDDNHTTDEKEMMVTPQPVHTPGISSP